MIINIDADKKPVVVISLLTAACLLGDSMLYIVLPIHWQDVGLASLWEVGVLLSVNRIVRLPFNPLVTLAYSRMTCRSGVIFAGVLAACTTISYAFIKGFALWLVFRCIWGIAWTFFRLGAFFTIVEMAGKNNRGYYMGIYNGLYRLGSLFGMLAGGFLADRYGLGNTAILFGLITCLAIPFAFQVLPRSSPHAPEAGKLQNVSTLVNANTLWPLLTGLFIALVYQGAFTSTLSYLIQIHTASQIPLFGALVGAASLAGILQALRWGWEPWLAPWFGRLSDGKHGRKKILTVTLFLAALFFSLIPLTLPLGWWLLLIIFILLTATILTTIIDAIACDAAVCSSQRNFMSVYSIALDLGAALGPLLSYALNDLSGPYAIYQVIAAGLLLLALKWLAYPTQSCKA